MTEKAMPPMWNRGERHPHPVVGGEPEAVVRQGVREAAQRLVAQHRSLGRRGGPGGVDDDGRVAGLDPLRPSGHLVCGGGPGHRVEARLREVAGAFLAAEQQDLPQVGGVGQVQPLRTGLCQSRQHRVDEFGEVGPAGLRGPGDQHAHTGVVEQVGELVLLEPPVDRDGDDAGLGRAEDGRDDVGAVGQEDPHPVAGADAEADEAAREPVGACGELRVGHPPVGEHEGFAVRVLRCPCVQQVSQAGNGDPSALRSLYHHNRSPLKDE